MSNRCDLICADVETGKAIWALDMMRQLGVFPHYRSVCAPLVVGDMVFVVTSNGVNKDHTDIPAPLAPSFLAVDKRIGKVLWQDNAPTANFRTPRGGFASGERREYFKMLANRADIVTNGQWSSPAYGVVDGQPQVVFPGGDGWLRSYEPTTGKLLWKFDCNPKKAEYVFAKGERSYFMAVPVIYKNHVYIGVGQTPEHKFGVGHLWCIDMTRRGDVSSEIRTADDSGFIKNPNSAAKWHYGGAVTDKNMIKKLRRIYHFGRTMSTCAIHDDLLYVSDLDGVLHCLNANTGAPIWEHNCEAEVWASPFYADGKVYLGTDDGVVRVFQHGRTKKLLAENDMGSTRVRGPLAANNGVLYVASEHRLYAIAQQK